MQNDLSAENSTAEFTIAECGKNYNSANNASYYKPKYYKQTYRTAWEQMLEFKGWLRGVPGQPQRAYCTFCQKSLHAHRLSLLKHTCTIRHQKAAQLHFIRQQHKNNPQGGEEGRSITDEMEPVNIVIAAGPSNEDGDEAIEENEVEEEFQQYEEYEGDEEEEIEEVETVNEIPTHLRKQARYQAQVSAMVNKPPISTHVLDTSKGTPVAGLQVSLYKLIDGRWTYINEAVTNPDGRCNGFLAREDFTAGRYKLHYDVDRYFDLRKQESLYPFIEIVFDCRAPIDHYHIPLLLTPFGYTTYRGT